MKYALIGRKFGRLLIVAEGAHKQFTSGIVKRWLCRCDCGKETLVYTGYLTSGHTTSCGCFREDNRPNLRLTHGHASKTASKRHPIYIAWREMLGRCENPKRGCYHYYGGRGISICAQWHSYEPFLHDVQASWFAGAQLERVDNNGNYTPENCRWATRLEQANNTRRNRWVTHQGERLTIAQLARKVGIKPYILYGRLNCNWTVEEAINL